MLFRSTQKSSNNHKLDNVLVHCLHTDLKMLIAWLFSFAPRQMVSHYLGLGEKSEKQQGLIRIMTKQNRISRGAETRISNWSPCRDILFLHSP